MISPATPRRRWLSFSLRTLFAVVTIVGVWLGVQVKWIRDRHEAISRIDEHGNARLEAYQDAAKAPWSLRIFGEQGYDALYIYSNDIRNPTADDWTFNARVLSLFPEATVGFTSEAPWYRPEWSAPAAH